MWATIISSHLTRKPTASPVLTKSWNSELTVATNFGSHPQILATKFFFFFTRLLKGWQWTLIITRYVDGTPTSVVTPLTILYIRPPHHGHKSKSWSWMDDSHPFRSLSIGRPIPEIKLFQTLTLKLQGQGYGCGQKGKVIQSAQYHINSLPFHFTSIRPTIPEIELFQNLTLKHPRSRSWVRSKIKVIYCTQCPTNALPFRFISIGPTIPEIWPK